MLPPKNISSQVCLQEGRQASNLLGTYLQTDVAAHQPPGLLRRDGPVQAHHLVPRLAQLTQGVVAALGKHDHRHHGQLLGGQTLLHPPVDLDEVGQGKLSEFLKMLRAPI